ncbi:Ubiquitin carboxyl-terminal hydrolase 34 [Halotydeus destructor]|nr:Ubiquitin carboxyl-terminal hydrolase 34 [Halotydeus destructor]
MKWRTFPRPIVLSKACHPLFSKLLSPSSPQKLIYSIQIVEWLRRSSKKEDKKWSEKFVEYGGLQHIFDIFVSGVLHQNESDNTWNEWKQDCLASLLQLIYQFGVIQNPREKLGEQSVQKDPESSVEAFVSKKKQRRKGSVDKLLVHQFNDKLLEMLKDINSMLRVLLTILQEATSRNSDANCYHTGFWGRPQVVHHTIVFLTSWVFSEAKVHVELFQSPNITNLLKKLVLDDPEPAVRREACSGFYKLYLGFTQDGKKGLKFIPPFLNSLLSFLPVAQSMRQTKSSVNEEVALLEKEPYGPGCKDYFWLVCRLVDSLDKEDEGSLNFDKVCSNIAEAIVRREVREMRHSNVEDEGLRGLLALMTMILKHNPSYKFSEAGRKFLAAVYEALFALPSKNDRNLPLCKVQSTRSGAFDLLVEISKGHEDNHALLLSMLKDQHNPAGHAPYPWDFWPHDDCRSDCGYVGLVNLGATCYMASCLQHLFMIPDMRNAILCAQTTKETKYESVLIELQKMFTFLLESERKSYNPKSFCKVYTMDHELLNTGEQKDMTEFFTDLIGKIEEMAPELNETVKNLFGGTLSNNVVSLDCPHISRTTEEFYTLRCKVADMRHIWDSLDELTVKDTLEGDNMYTCSQCGRKVRAEKRACIKKLPHILCFNTMRYTFNMITMMKEKVNTHFSFPLQLDMSAYLEENLIPGQSATERNIEKQETEYELIGVTVHTGTAEGGHYYCFIRERDQGKDRNRWYMFNDAEVKLFDPTQIGAECFGGEMTSKTYDSVTEKFMDFSFEKTNSAYMLFYERVTKEEPKTTIEDVVVSQDCDLPVELSTWIWNDNMQFARDKTVFDHAYFDFMWQICGVIPQSLQNNQKIQLMSTQLATFFVLETLIHSKEKPTIANWIELLTKQFNASTAACEWLMDHLTEECHWPIQILLKCPNQMVRQLFQRLCIHVITQLRQTHSNIYIQQAFDSENLDENRVSTPVGEVSCVTRFVKKYLSLTKMNHIVKPHPKHLTEYFAFLYEFAKMGDQEVRFLLAVEAISFIVQFYLSYCKAGNEYSDVMSDDDEEEDDDMGTSTGYQSYRGPQLMVVEEKSRPVSLDKMITLVAYLVEKSRGTDNMLRLSPNDIEIVFNGKQFPFLQRQIRDNINLRQTCNLICSLCRYNEAAASSIINMLLSVIHRQPETSGPFFRILSMMVDHTGEAGLPPFGNFVYPRIWEIAEHTPINSLEWLTGQVPRNKVAHSVVLQNLEQWVEFFLIGHPNQRVRNSAAVLLISLVPSTNFRQNYSKAPRVLQNQPRDSFELTNEAVTVIQRIFSCLLGLLKQAKTYADAQTHGTTKLVSYFAVMIYCLVNKSEKLLLVNYFMDLWHLFQPKLSEPPIAINQNKQALLTFWYQACTDCPENVRCIISNPQVMKNIAFNYILADHEDQDVIMFNRLMLPSYYGILRLCCVQSKTFTRQLAMHQNIQWAFKNITPYVNHYQTVVAELFKLMKLFIAVHPDTTEAEMREIRQFKKTSLQMYLTSIDPRSAWSTLISALSLLIEDESDRSFAILNNGIASLTQSFHSLFVMFHEATACHITNEIVELLKLSHDMLRTLRTSSEPEVREWMSKFKEHGEFIRKLILLLNTYTPAQVKLSSMNVLTEIIQVYPKDCLPLIAQSLGLGHLAFQDQYTSFLAGPYFPRRGQRILQTKSSLRPQRPIFQMHFHVKMLETSIGVDADYDKAIVEYFYSYYQFIIGICKIAISRGLVNQEIVGLCSIVALESLPLHLQLFPEFLLELASSKDKAACDFICLLCDHCTNFRDYALQILVRERDFLENDIVYRLLAQLLPKIPALVLPEAFVSNVMMFVESLSSQNTQCPVTDLSKLLVELRCVLLFSKIGKVAIEPKFVTVLEKLKEDIRHDHCSSPEETPQKKRKKSDSSSADDLASDETMMATTSSAVILEARLQNAICELIQVEKDE